MTEGALAQAVAALTGDHRLSFYDAVAPIVTAESLDYDKVFAASRYGRGEADYLNCPFNKEEYESFHAALIAAERAPLHDFDGDLTVYEGCMPIEVMAARGADTIRFRAAAPGRPARPAHRPPPVGGCAAAGRKHGPHALQPCWVPDEPEMGRAEAGVQHDPRSGAR